MNKQEYQKFWDDHPGLRDKARNVWVYATASFECCFFTVFVAAIAFLSGEKSLFYVSVAATVILLVASELLQRTQSFKLYSDWRRVRDGRRS